MRNRFEEQHTTKKFGIGERLLATPRTSGVSPAALVKTEYLMPGLTLPLIIKPAVKGLDATSWVRANRDYLERELMKHGAILFRRFELHSVKQFEQFVEALCGELLPYLERSSPRHEVGENVYTSTDYPAEESIFPHNEHSYSLELPLKLFFFCMTPAEKGGETPLADTRKIYQRIDPQIRQRFIEKKYAYVRNFGDGFGVPWQMAFQTTDKAEVEAYCRAHGIEVEWKPGNRLRTRQIRPAVAMHPRTGEPVWFNHATFFHLSTLDPLMGQMLLEEFGEEDLPNNTYYGDGTPIEPEVLDALREAYLSELVKFTWQQGDLVLLDNMLTSHARAPYEGPRKILFAMSDRYVRTDA